MSEILTEKEQEQLSQEITKTVDELNALLQRASWANLRIDIDQFNSQVVGQKWPAPILQITILKEI